MSRPLAAALLLAAATAAGLAAAAARLPRTYESIGALD